MGVPELIIAGVSAAVSYKQQSDAAQAQADYQSSVNLSKTKAAVEQYQELDKLDADNIYNAANDSLDLQIKALEAKSQQETYSSATGIRGRTVDMINADLSRKEAQGYTDIELNQQQGLDNVDAQSRSIRNQTRASLDHSPIQKPSILQAASTGLQFGMSANSIKNGLSTASKGASQFRKTTPSIK